MGNATTTQTLKYYKNDKHMFALDACDRSNKIIEEFNGFYRHGCPTCFPKCKAKYNTTMVNKLIGIGWIHG